MIKAFGYWIEQQQQQKGETIHMLNYLVFRQTMSFIMFMCVYIGGWHSHLTIILILNTCIKTNHILSKV